MNDDVLKPFRDQIDVLDEEIVRLLGHRVQIVRKVAISKHENGLSVVRPKRMEVVLDKAEELAKSNDIKPSVVRHIYATLIDYAHELEQEIIDEKI
ncbi:MAG: chorismate mutase [Alphaproteobacteria bacterium]|nr:chorismate mutase [Alphaproteobacteria bacterium]